MSKSKGTRVKFPAKKKSIYTMGSGSALDLKARGLITTAACVLWYYIERYSTWDKGVSKRLTIKQMMRGTGLSARTVYRCIADLKKVGLLKQITPKATEFMIFHLYPFEDRSKRETNCLAMGGKHDPFQLLKHQDIDRETFIAMLHLNIGWQITCGITTPKSLRNWAKQIGIGVKKMWDAVQRLLKLGWIARLSKPWNTSIFHLKLFPNPTDPTEQERVDLIVATDPNGVEFLDNGIVTYQGERYKCEAIGWSRWMHPITKWIFVTERVPTEVKEAAERRRAYHKGFLNALPA